MWWRQYPNASLIDSSHLRVALLDAWHGSPAGVVQADEHLAGSMPSHGTELCGIAEALYSHLSLGDILGDASWFDRAELIAYSAYPAALSKDMWAHNYLSEANEATAIKVSYMYGRGGVVDDLLKHPSPPPTPPRTSE